MYILNFSALRKHRRRIQRPTGSSGGSGDVLELELELELRVAGVAQAASAAGLGLRHRLGETLCLRSRGCLFTGVFAGDEELPMTPSRRVPRFPERTGSRSPAAELAAAVPRPRRRVTRASPSPSPGRCGARVRRPCGWDALARGGPAPSPCSSLPRTRCTAL